MMVSSAKQGAVQTMWFQQTSRDFHYSDYPADDLGSESDMVIGEQFGVVWNSCKSPIADRQRLRHACLHKCYSVISKRNQRQAFSSLPHFTSHVNMLRLSTSQI